MHNSEGHRGYYSTEPHRNQTDVEQVYILRIWSEVDEQGHSMRRYSLLHPHTHTQRAFATIDELAAFLDQR